MKCRNIVKNENGFDVVFFGSIGKNQDGTAKKYDNYITNNNGVISSLTQKLSVLKSELWFNVNYGLPLLDKTSNKILFDSTVAKIINENKDVESILSFNSYIQDRHYYCDITLNTKYGILDISI